MEGRTKVGPWTEPTCFALFSATVVVLSLDLRVPPLAIVMPFFHLMQYGYLCNIGIIDPGSPMWSPLAAAEIMNHRTGTGRHLPKPTVDNKRTRLAVAAGMNWPSNIHRRSTCWLFCPFCPVGHAMVYTSIMLCGRVRAKVGGGCWLCVAAHTCLLVRHRSLVLAFAGRLRLMSRLSRSLGVEGIFGSNYSFAILLSLAIDCGSYVWTTYERGVKHKKKKRKKKIDFP